jgi:uncharacterized protein (TIGR02284 family)
MDNQQVIATLNSLLQTTKDGSKGFRTCAKDVKKGSLTPVFESSAQRCDDGAAVLETQIRKLGGEPATSGSVGGTLHRRWTDIMSSVTGMEKTPRCVITRRLSKRICRRISRPLCVDSMWA